MLDGAHYFICDCGEMDHTLRFVLDLDERSEIRFPTIYTDIRLNHYLPWYRRVWIGIKYIFGADIPQTHDSWMIHNSEDATRMIGMLQQFIVVAEQLKGKVYTFEYPTEPK